MGFFCLPACAPQVLRLEVCRGFQAPDGQQTSWAGFHCETLQGVLTSGAADTGAGLESEPHRACPGPPFPHRLARSALCCVIFTILVNTAGPH